LAGAEIHRKFADRSGPAGKKGQKPVNGAGMHDEGDHPRSENQPFWEARLAENWVKLHRYACRLSDGDGTEADDLLQELALRILRALPEPAQVECPQAYLMTTLKRLNFTKWSRQRNIKTESLEDEKGKVKQGIPNVEPDAPRLLDNQDLWETLFKLGGPFTDRENKLLKLHLKAYEATEIAELLNEDVRIIRADLNAIKAKIRYRLKSRCL
jgi:RNA polymerase sigma factor (sigma-70 family)